jgi:hypothetical protein
VRESTLLKAALLLLLCAAPLWAQDKAVPLRFHISAQNEVVHFRTRLRVPSKLPAYGTLFIWPGLQPYGRNFLPLDNGVLQPVLTWGKSCAPGKQPTPYSTWWISAQYVNTFGHAPGYTGCSGGEIMTVEPGQMLTLLFWLEGSLWHQLVLDESTGKSVTFTIDMKSQAQTEVIFDLESWASPPIEGVEFLDTEFTLRNPEPSACQPVERTLADFVSTPTVNRDGNTCRIDRIALSIHTQAPAVISPATCTDQSHTKSLDAATPIKVEFLNHHGSPVSIYWLDYNGKPQLYNILGIGQPLQISTYTTHPWLIAAADNTCLGIYVATPQAHQFEIK